MSAPYYVDESVTLWLGDALDVLRTMPDASVDSIVTDPPYGLGFMGRQWDDLPPGLPWARECLRVLKPGGHLLAFGGSRTWHRLACAVEDAGFEIRDSIAWLYGSGFPKSLNVERSVDTFLCVLPGRHRWTPQACTLPGDHVCPSTAEGRTHAGDGTALKPSFEPIVVARKPLAGTVAANVLAHGTGALNVDGCRVAVSDTDRANVIGREYVAPSTRTAYSSFGDDGTRKPIAYAPAGRWPTNVILDESQAAELDRQSGTQRDGFHVGRNRDATEKPGGYDGGWRKDSSDGGYGGSGGASRFFPTFHYEAKAPTSERPTYVQEGAGTGRVTGLGGKVRQCNVCETRAIESGATEPSCGHGDFRWEEPTTDTRSRIAHPTVKPLDLMRWLVRLVTPPGGLVLDPFAGSGTTAEACVVEGFRCVLIEREADYLPLIVARLSKPIAPILDFGASA